MIQGVVIFLGVCLKSDSDMYQKKQDFGQYRLKAGSVFELALTEKVGSGSGFKLSSILCRSVTLVNISKYNEIGLFKICYFIIIRREPEWPAAAAQSQRRYRYVFLYILYRILPIDYFYLISGSDQIYMV